MAAEPAMRGDLELDDMALEALAEAYAVPAPAGLRVRIAAAVALDRAERSAARRLRLARIVGAMAAAATLVFAGLLAREMRSGSERDREVATLARRNGDLAARLEEQRHELLALRETLETQSRELVGLREAVDAQSRVLRLVGGPRIRTATLAPPAGRTGAGRVLVDATSGDAAVVLSGLPPAGEDETYELWAIRGKKPPEPAGLIALADGRGAAVRVPSLARPGEVTAFAVSIEPRGGSSAPTGPIVLVGRVAG
jgi:anti-sigma-K factor RskA